MTHPLSVHPNCMNHHAFHLRCSRARQKCLLCGCSGARHAESGFTVGLSALASTAVLLCAHAFHREGGREIHQGASVCLATAGKAPWSEEKAHSQSELEGVPDALRCHLTTPCEVFARRLRVFRCGGWLVGHRRCCMRCSNALRAHRAALRR